MRSLSYDVAGRCNGPLESKRSSNYGITRSRHGSAEEQERTGTIRWLVLLWGEREQDLTEIKRERHERQALELGLGFILRLIKRELEEQQVACNAMVCGAW
jgi:hypothetical protein